MDNCPPTSFSRSFMLVKPSPEEELRFFDVLARQDLIERTLAEDAVRERRGFRSDGIPADPACPP